MRVTTADLWSPEPGRLLRWDVRATDPGRPTSLSLNQRNHLAGADAGEATVWLAAAFDVDGPIDVTALERAFQALVARHSSLQLGVEPGPEGPVAVLHDPGRLRWLVREDAHPSTVPQMRAVLAEALGEGCRPYGYAAFAPLAISRRHRSTVILGMDHLHCDAFSTTVVVDDLARLYDAFRRDPYGDLEQAPLPDAGCFATSVAAEVDDPVRVWHDDQRLRAWHAFARERDFTLPIFPLGLGVAPGERVAQSSVVAVLADAATTAGLAEAGSAESASTYAVVLAALAAAVRDLGGPDRLDTLAPVQTRTEQAARRSIGWYTTTVPVSVTADTSPAGLAAAGEAVRQGVRLGAVPLDQVMATLPEPLRPLRRDVFMVSWIDYRHLPGAAEAEGRNAHHVSAATLADDLQLWVSRTDAGLAVRVRHPATDVAREVVAALLDAWRARLQQIATRTPAVSF